MLVKPPRGASLDLLHPLYRDLRGFWLFNEYTNGKIVDYTHKSNIGNLSGTPIWTSDGLKLNGISDFIDIGQNKSLEVANITYEIYLIINGTHGGDYGGLYQDTYYAAHARNRILVGDTGKLLAQFYIPDAATSISTWAPDGSVLPGVLTRIVFRYDGTNCVFFVDNTKHTPVAATGDIAIDNRQGANIGCGAPAAPLYFLNATVYMVRLWGRGLSDVELMRLGNDPFPV